jgi:hypothetical protein
MMEAVDFMDSLDHPDPFKVCPPPDAQTPSGSSSEEATSTALPLFRHTLKRHNSSDEETAYKPIRSMTGLRLAEEEAMREVENEDEEEDSHCGATRKIGFINLQVDMKT